MLRFITFFLITFFLCQPSLAHTILLKDGRKITADKVWQEEQGFQVTDLTIYGCKKDGVSESLLEDINTFKHRLTVTKELLLQHIEQKIGSNGMKIARQCLDTYIEKKVLLSYESHGATIGIDFASVQEVQYDTPQQPIRSNLIHPDDYETQQVIAKEKERLYALLDASRKRRAGLTAGSPVRSYYRKQEAIYQSLIDEIEHDPIGYFLRREPWKVHLSKVLSEKECASICGGKVSPVATPTIRDTSSEHWDFKHCMNYCTKPLREKEQRKASENKN